MRVLNNPLVLRDRIEFGGDRRVIVLGSHKSTDLLSVSMVSEAAGDLLTISLDPVDPKLKFILEEGEFYVKGWSIDASMKEALISSGAIDVVISKKKAWMQGAEIWKLKGPALDQFSAALDKQEADGEELSAGEAPKA